MIKGEDFELLEDLVKNLSGRFKHDRIVKELESRLENYNRFGLVMSNEEYHKNNVHGEVDVLAFDEIFKTWHFYEVKSRYTPSNLIKAQGQYYKFQEAFPELKSNGLMVFDKGIVRLKNRNI